MAAMRLDLIGRYLRPHRRTVLLGALALVVVNILSVTIPMEVRRVIDELQDGFSYDRVLRQAGWIVVLATTMGGVRLLSRQLVFGIGRQVEVELRQRLFDNMLRQEPAWVQSTGSGEVISRSTSDVENVRRLLGFALLSLTNTVLVYSFTLPAMLTIDPWLSLAAISLYPVMLLVVRVSGGRMMGQQRQQQRDLASLSDLIQEDLSGISAIKIYRQEPTEEAAFSRLSNRYRDAALALARTRSTLFPLLEGISSLSLLVLLGLGTSQLANGNLTLGGLVALILYVERLVFPTALLGFTLSTFQTGQVSLERVEELLRREPAIQSPVQPEELHRISRPGGIEAHDLHVRYEESSSDALKGLSFHITPGELVAVVGPVGCGKTTLARALGRMVEVPAGQLSIDGQDITALSLDDLRSKISLVPQEGYLFTATLAENLRFGRPDATDSEMQQAARQAQLEGDVQAFPNGYETLVGERGITLSGGQRQRTALARALLVKAPILVLDDALASVDNRTAAAILQSLTLNQQRSVLFISHQLSAAAACDRVLVLDGGQVVQQGHHRELVQQNGTYRRLWEREQAATQLEAA